MFRGSSKPLYDTASGVCESVVMVFVKELHGECRIPIILKLVDSLCFMDIEQGEYRIAEINHGHPRKLDKVNHDN